MRIELNIGLEVANGGNSLYARSARAVKAMRALAGWATYDLLARSNTEETLVMVCHVTPEDMFDFHAAVYELAVEIKQDCIAVYNATRLSGALIGPNAAAWGEFNPEFFIRYDESEGPAKIHTPKVPGPATAAVRYTGHGAKTGGLQGHSVGADYPYMIVGVQDRYEAPTRYRVMDTRTSKMSESFPTQQRAIIEMASLRTRNMMHG